MKMDKLKRTLSFRRRKDPEPESAKPHQWQDDEVKVRTGNCSFQVKYLGCLEVFESRGMQVCEDAVKTLKHRSKAGMAKAVRAILYVSGDGLRVVDQESKGLIVDQTIEKVSFCAPDRSHERGFAYICRDGTTRRWMCHGFMALRESGERLSHAVGCAFALCLERKLKRDKDCGVTANFATDKTSFERMGSFRQATITEKMVDPQSAIVQEPIPMRSVDTPHAVPRPHASATMMQRQGSFRGFAQLNQTSSPFKRTVSLRIGELPSTLQRQMRSHSDSLQSGTGAANGIHGGAANPINGVHGVNDPAVNGQADLESPTGSIISGASSIGAMSLPPGVGASTAPNARSDVDLISSMCQKISTDLGALGADWDSSSEILEVAKASRFPQSNLQGFDSVSVPNMTSSSSSPPPPCSSVSPSLQVSSVSPPLLAPSTAASPPLFPPPPIARVKPPAPANASASSFRTTSVLAPAAAKTRPPTVPDTCDKKIPSTVVSHHSRAASIDLGATPFAGSTPTPPQRTAPLYSSFRSTDGRSTGVTLTAPNCAGSGHNGVPGAPDFDPFDAQWALLGKTSSLTSRGRGYGSTDSAHGRNAVNAPSHASVPSVNASSKRNYAMTTTTSTNPFEIDIIRKTFEVNL